MGAGAAGLDVAGAVPAKRRRVLAAKTRVGRPPQARRRAQPQPPTPLQRLFRACRAVFRGPGTVPAPPEVALLRAMLDRMRPEDVGLSPDMRFFRTRDNAAQGNPTITHTTIYKSDNFSMVILFLPQNAVIPLHNHPGMTVFSKPLIGSMHIKSYDWADPDDDPAASSPDDQLRLAELVVDDLFTAPCNTSVLYPTAGGNMHRFTAIAPCAILDILGPPYSIEEDRDCTYYADVPYSSQHPKGRRLAWLKEVDMPRDLKMCSVRYGGPRISDR
ncbi:plant cysteine oxidase 2 isoform X2 [Aegilops tauschii subsp. strangulata]|nr:plant cysteine oxidase 2 isoform X2 [Aegilops tauschii subsp. strangulata]